MKDIVISWVAVIGWVFLWGSLIYAAFGYSIPVGIAVIGAFLLVTAILAVAADA